MTKIKEEDLLKYGFERIDVSIEDSGDKPFHYYTLDLCDDKISLITDEITDEPIKVYLFDNDYYIDTIQELEILITGLKQLKK